MGGEALILVLIEMVVYVKVVDVLHVVVERVFGQKGG
jgi:hypothetical protein